MESGSESLAGLAFGRFLLLPDQRELLADGRKLKLGGRAFDVLLALVGAAGDVLAKDALMARVWSDRIVDDNALQAQISALRAALGPDRELIRTVAGRGYQFTGDVRASAAFPPDLPLLAAAPARTVPATNLPEPVSELIGRDDEVDRVVGLVAAQRLVTLTGAGGIGKTRLALAAARRLLPAFPDGAWLAELSPLADPDLVPAAIAASIGLDLVGGAVSAERVAAAASGKHLLLLLDTCEHVIDAAAAAAEAILRAGPAVHVLATSREPLRAEGEWVHAVPPLAVPAEDAADQEDARRYGALRLFVERARAAEQDFSPDPRRAGAIAGLCRRLDGMPLAIELAAARAAALGIETLAAHLDDRFQLLSGGRRTALPRHQTLRATLDWSHELLAEPERLVLRRVAVFAGGFGLDAAGAVAASRGLTAAAVVECVAGLVAKSLVIAEMDGAAARYRLLDTTRAYALDKLAASGERDAVARRHAEYYRALFERGESAVEGPPALTRHIDNLRAALDWAFGPTGEAAIGVALTEAAVPLWMHLSLLEECRGRVAQALPAVPAGNRREMTLQAALGFALMFTTGMTPQADAALTKAVDLAERLGDFDYQLRTLFGLCVFRLRLPDFRSALALARRCAAIAGRVADPIATPTADWMLGLTLFCLGDLADGRAHMESVRDTYRPPSRRAEIVRFGFDQRVYALGILGLAYWIEGFPERAVGESRTAVAEAQTLEHPVSLCIALWTGCLVSLWCGDLVALAQSAEALLLHTRKYSLMNYNAYAMGFAGELAVRRGDAAEGIRLLRAGLEQLRAARHQVFYSVFLALLARRVAENDNPPEGLALIEEAVARAESNDEWWYMPELLRTKADLLLRAGGGAAAEAEDHLRRAIALAQKQGARSWELRAAVGLARLWRDAGRAAEAAALLNPVYARFTEGFGTADLKAASALV